MTTKKIVTVAAVTPQALLSTDPVTGPSSLFEANLVEPGRMTQAGEEIHVIDAKSAKKQGMKRLSSHASLENGAPPTKVMKSGIGDPTDSQSHANLRRLSSAPANWVNELTGEKSICTSTGLDVTSCMTTELTDGAEVGVGASIGSGLFGGLSANSSYIPHAIHQHSELLSDSTDLFTNLPFATNMPFADTSLGYFEPSFGQSAVFGDIGGDGYGQKQLSQHPASLQGPSQFAGLPAFVKLPCVKITEENLIRLNDEGALTLPPPPIQNALLQSYAECVHPQVPLLELYDFLAITNDRSGSNGQISLLLYQAVMFAATAFVDTIILTQAGYSTVKAARKAFFRRTRLLYDINYESDNLVTLQALLLMTYWDDGPNDVEDSWHWMGVAVKLAHTIGLHRNSTTITMSPLKKRLWKRIWWSCFMRDRLIALGMRRPTRIKDGDCGVPMLEWSDFESCVLPGSNTIIPAECALLRDISMQTKLAELCISRARLCICIGHVLDADPDSLKSIDSAHLELMAWAKTLPPTCQYGRLTPSEVKNGHSTVAIQRTLLHMIYFATLSALHRPQASRPSLVIGASEFTRQTQDYSTWRVRDAAMKLTYMASELRHLHLERYLATVCVTVLLPAAVIHLLDMRSPDACFREPAACSFLRCMDVMRKLHNVDAASESASGFLCALVRRFFTESNFQPLTRMRLSFLLANSTGLANTTHDVGPGLQGNDGHLAHHCTVHYRNIHTPADADGLDFSANPSSDNASKQNMLKSTSDGISLPSFQS